MGVFQRKEHHAYIGTISSAQKGIGKWERDETLYRDEKDGRFFIVDQEETMSGPDFHASHTVTPISNDQAMGFIESNDEMKQRLAELQSKD